MFALFPMQTFVEVWSELTAHDSCVDIDSMGNPEQSPLLQALYVIVELVEDQARTKDSGDKPDIYLMSSFMDEYTLGAIRHLMEMRDKYNYMVYKSIDKAQKKGAKQ